MVSMKEAVDFIKHRFVFIINDNNVEEIYLKPIDDGYQVIVILGDDYVQKKSELTNIKIKFEHIFLDKPCLRPKVYQYTNHFEPDYLCTKIWSRQTDYLIR